MNLSTLVQKFANVFLVPSGRDVFVSGELGEKRGEIGFGELPFEGLGGDVHPNEEPPLRPEYYFASFMRSRALAWSESAPAASPEARRAEARFT